MIIDAALGRALRELLKALFLFEDLRPSEPAKDAVIILTVHPPEKKG